MEMDVVSPVASTAANHSQSHKNPFSNFCETHTVTFSHLHILMHSNIYTHSCVRTYTDHLHWNFIFFDGERDISLVNADSQFSLPAVTTSQLADVSVFSIASCAYTWIFVDSAVNKLAKNPFIKLIKGIQSKSEHANYCNDCDLICVKS